MWILPGTKQELLLLAAPVSLVSVKRGTFVRFKQLSSEICDAERVALRCQIL